LVAGTYPLSPKVKVERPGAAAKGTIITRFVLSIDGGGEPRQGLAVSSNPKCHLKLNRGALVRMHLTTGWVIFARNCRQVGGR
jgi:hypothetical protein